MKNDAGLSGLVMQLPMAALIVLLAVVIGLSVHWPMLGKVFRGESLSTAPAALQSSDSATASVTVPEPVDLADIRPMVDAGALLIDARHRDDYSEGHLPGALSLPLGEISLLLADFTQQVPLSTPLILYCSGFDCPDSFDLALQLIEAGYTRVSVFEGGVPQWRDAGLPLEEGGYE